MAFELQQVVPWGRNLDEYTSMFNLSDLNVTTKIASFGDGPASFNAEMSMLNMNVVSFDPIYQFSKESLNKRFTETKEIVLEQTRANLSNFIWTNIHDIDHLAQIRIEAMTNFLDDFEIGKKQGRYISHELPAATNYSDLSFDLGLSSHFLFLYSQLGLEFHIRSITEMLRLCKEVRIFPLLNLNARKSEVLDGVIAHFSNGFLIDIVPVLYEFQKNGNEMLRIRH